MCTRAVSRAAWNTAANLLAVPRTVHKQRRNNFLEMLRRPGSGPAELSKSSRPQSLLACRRSWSVLSGVGVGVVDAPRCEGRVA